MKVLNYTTSYLAIILLVVISIWAGIYYYAMLDEIYDSIDDGLDNQKGLILQKVNVDSSILYKSGFDEGDYAITEIPAEIAKTFNDVYTDTSMYMQNEQDFEPVRLLQTAFQHKGKYYRMQIITSMVEEDDLVSELFYALLWLYGGLVLVILTLNNFLLRRTWKPFYHLLKQLKIFRLETPSIHVKPTRIEEFRMLNEAVQKMIQSNVDSYNIQKHFIENASHELQTPLAIAINKLEALAEHKQFSQEESKLLASALENLERLTRLNKSLLLLSRIENKQFGSEVNVNINDLVKKITGDFEDQLQFKKLETEIIEDGICMVEMNPDLAAILVINLVKNAIVHNKMDGMVKIRITDKSLVISNMGQNNPLNEQTLFSRFNKEVQSGPSTGLGLAIVKAITNLYSFHISYKFDGLHHMEIDFK